MAWPICWMWSGRTTGPTRFLRRHAQKLTRKDCRNGECARPRPVAGGARPSRSTRGSLSGRARIILASRGAGRRSHAALAFWIVRTGRMCAGWSGRAGGRRSQWCTWSAERSRRRSLRPIRGYELQQMGGEETAFADWTPESLDPHDEHVEVYSKLQGCGTVAEWYVAWQQGTQCGRCSQNMDRCIRIGRSAGEVRRWQDAGDAEDSREAGLDSVDSSQCARRQRVRRRCAVAGGGDGWAGKPGSARCFQADIQSERGRGEIVAVDNGDLASHEPFQATRLGQRSMERLSCIVRATAKTGEIRGERFRRMACRMVWRSYRLANNKQDTKA